MFVLLRAAVIRHQRRNCKIGISRVLRWNRKYLYTSKKGNAVKQFLMNFSSANNMSRLSRKNKNSKTHAKHVRVFNSTRGKVKHGLR